MEKQKGKIRTWYEENKEEIKSKLVKGVCIIGGFISGSIVATKVANMNHKLGMAALHNDGLVKYFNPSTGQEISPYEISDVAREFYSK